MQHGFDPGLYPHLPEGQGAGGHQPGRRTAGQKGFGISLAVRPAFPPRHLFIAGHFNIPAQQHIRRPQQGIEPVEG